MEDGQKFHELKGLLMSWKALASCPFLQLPTAFYLPAKES